ncbi:hypothetical protein [Zavarzinella formosa]|uniref:hypothetical protein n=1 Tax=Zavarzinella formosa TaxID=360055 RepID=UPI0002DC6605|nr:hypothetical protein [Zavarzinella formosa]
MSLDAKTTKRIVELTNVEAPAEALGRQMAALTTDPAIGSIHITIVHDDDGPPHVSVTVLADGHRRVASGATIGQAVAKLTDGEAKKRCPKCGQTKPLLSFGTRGKPKKPSCYCKRCEAARISEYCRRKRVANNELKERIAAIGSDDSLVRVGEQPAEVGDEGPSVPRSGTRNHELCPDRV